MGAYLHHGQPGSFATVDCLSARERILYDRWPGSELSVLEKELIFHRENTGFVEYDTKDGKYFYLHPSPFLNSPKREIFCAESCDPPAEHTFVEVEIESEREFMPNGSQDRITVKTICGWKPFDPSPLAERRKIMDYEEIVYYFTLPFRGEEETIEQIAKCSALYSLSSPPIADEVGGINAAILGKKTQWNTFKGSMKVIPQDFFRPCSRYYYYISDQEKCTVKRGCEEANRAIYRPDEYIMDIPLVMEEASLNQLSKDCRELINEERPIITSYILDALIIKPDPMNSVEKTIIDAVHTIREEYKRTGYSPYKQNLGDAIPKLTSSLARLQRASKTTQSDVKDVVELWLDMHWKANKIYSSPLKVAKRYDLLDTARKLYVELHDIYGLEFWIPLDEAVTRTTLHPEEFMVSLESLIFAGYAVRKAGAIKIL